MQSVEKVLSSKPSKQESKKFRELQSKISLWGQQIFWGIVVFGCGILSIHAGLLDLAREVDSKEVLSVVLAVVAVYGFYKAANINRE